MFSKEKLNKIEVWANRHAEGSHTKFWLGVTAFTDACCFIIPPDVVLIASLAIKQRKWLQYSLLVVFWSVLGGVFGYIIGFFFAPLGYKIISFYGLTEQVAWVGDRFSANAFWTIFVAAFTPIPYKAFTIPAGFFNINFGVFLVASIIGRGLRYILTGYVMNIFGKKICTVIFKYFNILTLIVVIVVVVLVARSLL